MLPRPTAEPIAERMNTFRELNASRLWVCVVAVAMRARLPEGRPDSHSTPDSPAQEPTRKPPPERGFLCGDGGI
ncbi:hypothetical protein GCM10010213_29100 [Microbacterium maritypicum]|nr:hypothetical protein GCM10010213_29100 [Microbacterium liquefaciens]